MISRKIAMLLAAMSVVATVAGVIKLARKTYRSSPADLSGRNAGKSDEPKATVKKMVPQNPDGYFGGAARA